jgi:hypothetical protein
LACAADLALTLEEDFAAATVECSPCVPVFEYRTPRKIATNIAITINR